MVERRRIISYMTQRLRPLTKEHCVINEETELVETLNFDSLKIMELILEIEDHFDISIPVNILKDVKTLKDLAVQIENSLVVKNEHI